MIVEEHPDLESFRQAVKPVYKIYGKKFRKLLDEIQKQLKEMRSK